MIGVRCFMERGKFIVLEGIDGSGKSTHAKLLCEALRERGIPCEHTFEPTDRPVGALLRRYLKGELKTCERTIAGLFLSDRLDHITHPEGLLAKLNAGISIVCDRYYFSSIAYNCISESIEWVRNLNMAARELLAPDLVIFLNIPAEIMEKRLERRDYKEIYENLDNQRKVRARYFEAFKAVDDPVAVIDCCREKIDVAKDVLHTALKLYK